MSIVATCPCGMRFAARPDMAGQVVRCTSCGRTFQVPLSSATGPSPLDSLAPMTDGGAPTYPYQGWQAGPAPKRPKPRTALWVALGAAAVVVIVLIVAGVGAMVAWTTWRSPIAPQIPPGGSTEAPSAPHGDVPSALPRGPARNVGYRHGDVAPIKWTVIPDPAPSPRFGVEPLTVLERAQFERLLFSSAAAGQALLRTTFPGDSGKHALFRIDLKSNHTLAQALVDRQLEVLAVSPDGELALIKTGVRQLTVYRWEGKDLRVVRTIVLNRPPLSIVPHFVDSGHIVLFDYADDGVSGWEIASARRTFFVELKHHTPMVLSPGRRYFVVREFYADTFSVYETGTGKRAGTLRAPRTGEQRIVTFSFRPDGKILAALVQEDDHSRRLICWDVATGSIVDNIPMTSSPASDEDPLIWLDQRFVGVLHSGGEINVSLLDLANHDHVWTYTAERPYTYSADKIAPDPGDRIWLERYKQSDAPAAVVPFVLPREAELEAIEREYAGPPLLKPGDAVALRVQVEGAVPAAGRPDAEQLRAALPELLKKKLTDNGIRIDDGAPLRFQAAVKYDIDPERMWQIRVWYDDAVGLPNYHELQVPRETVTLELSIRGAEGKTPWRRTVVCTTDSVGPVQGLSNAQLKNEPQAAAARGPWLKAQGWLERLQLPREFRPQRGQPVGTSQIP